MKTHYSQQELTLQCPEDLSLSQTQSSSSSCLTRRCLLCRRSLGGGQEGSLSSLALVPTVFREWLVARSATFATFPTVARLSPRLHICRFVLNLTLFRLLNQSTLQIGKDYRVDHNFCRFIWEATRASGHSPAQRPTVAQALPGEMTCCDTLEVSTVRPISLVSTVERVLVGKITWSSTLPVVARL